jgi:hypothetical protein
MHAEGHENFAKEAVEKYASTFSALRIKRYK